MANLYSYKGNEPEELPQRIRLTGGATRTDSSSFSESEIANAGFDGPYTKPEYDVETQTLKWDSENREWNISSIPNSYFWDRMRDRRNFHLATSDWTQFGDSPLTEEKKEEWKVYRQELRDLPSITTDPKNVTWPSIPE